MTQKRRLEEINVQCWLEGIYVTYALGGILSQHTKYPEVPLNLFGEKIDAQERAKQEAEIFRAYVAEYNQMLKKNVTSEND